MDLEKHFKYFGEKRNDLARAEKELNNYLKFFGKKRGLKTVITVDFSKFYNPSIIHSALENLVKKGEISEEQTIVYFDGSEKECSFYVPVYKSFFEKVKYCFKIPPIRFW
ncbi:hypothetical protein HZA97_00975 [Candidatus Woesearchaeota archaeon]|nr:hypothetical protein [Candidatus Woesearchaeota archaeon]